MMQPLQLSSRRSTHNMSSKRVVLATLGAVTLAPSRAFGCTPARGLDPDAFYRAIALPGCAASAVSALAAIAWIAITRERNTRRSNVLMALAVLNPGWWLWGIGDCGTLAFEVGGLFAVASLAILARGLWQRRQRSSATIAPLSSRR